jgi:hypothetical protein
MEGEELARLDVGYISTIPLPRRQVVEGRKGIVAMSATRREVLSG